MASTTAPRILVVDDEPDLRTLYELTLLQVGYEVQSAADLAQARECLAQGTYQLLITDMRLPDGLGLELVRELQRGRRCEKAIVVTAYGSAENAVEALKAGAFDYLTKPVDLAQFRLAVANALREGRSGTDAAAWAAPAVSATAPSVCLAQPGTLGAEAQAALACMVGDAPAMQAVRERVLRSARSMAPVMVLGESGTGKELAARALHACSHRSDGPFVAVNCGAIPEALIEAEFFGVRKGAYTGATADRPGYFHAASGGTLFLDEIGDLPLAMQAKLLRAIQERQVRALGATQLEPTDVRVVSATHHDVARAVREGRFRQDLYYRLNVIELRMVPLRERRGDLPALAAAMLQRIAQRNAEPVVPSLSEQALAHLAAYPFPGNVRELENMLERALALYPGPVLTAAAFELPLVDEDLPPFSDSGFAITQSPTAPDDADPPLSRESLHKLLMQNRWNQSRTARELGWTLAKLRYWMLRLGLADPVVPR